MKTMSGELRKQLIDEIIQRHTDGELTLGMAIRRLRLEVTGFDQESFAQMCGMSTRALYQLETDKGNPTLNTIDSIVRKFGLRMGLIKAISPSKRSSLVAAVSSNRDRTIAVTHNGVPENRQTTSVTSRGAKPKGAAGNKPAAGKPRNVVQKQPPE
ncbi:MAG: helix-turn-helix domain-containing protein [Gammaproteobacteria bacterium]|nr:helix-turn-helix domain-containing protein [Gammaproteobacteria bacterium]MBU1489998.1 helix-turn-helix domain-containing protein [Gammaproteobacteria bacterium]MBU2064239.1 helix-turn-helix domain-containing protein [Gammaproteobacteria bacterium]MBU2137876.1 helix-turn-helix domain-containing protein [Gammaproteobacteria bacterium]MBU2325585.1 helix-turn-helix domain-containing protein [Gammaproteobacteria bacterium]